MVATVGRTRHLTPDAVNARIWAATEARLAYYSAHPEEIEGRLRDLDEEWDTERAIELEVAGTVFTGVFLGLTVSKKWYLLPAVAGAMLLLHNLHGEYPLLPLLRRLGLRTPHEIAEERYALKAMRGDFKHVTRSNGKHQARRALHAAQPTGPAPEPPAPSI